MLSVEILRQFLQQSYFTQGTIIIKDRDISYDKGHLTESAVTQTTLKQKKVWIPVSASQMQDLGFGQYNGYENYWLYVLSAIQLQSGSEMKKSSIVEFKGKDFQMLKQLDFETHGFYGYLFTSYNGVLND
jgi:hypothetical protein